MFWPNYHRLLLLFSNSSQEMENLDFSEEEIQEQLAVLGYDNLTKQRLRDFKRGGFLLISNLVIFKGLKC